MAQEYKLKKFLNSIKVDANIFKKVFIYTAAYFVIFFSISEIFGRIFQSLSSRVTGLDLSGIATGEANAQLGSVNSTVTMLLIMVILFIAALLYSYSYFENLIWNTIYGKKTTLNSTNKFLVFNLILSVILTGIVLIIFAAISNLQGSAIKIGVTIFYLAVLLAFYLLYVGYVSFGRTHEVIKSVKNSFSIGIGKLGVTIYPLVVSLLILLASNILTVFSWLPDTAYEILLGAVFAAYLAWFRIYMSNTLKSVKL